jgi:hypothetical protein
MSQTDKLTADAMRCLFKEMVGEAVYRKFADRVIHDIGTHHELRYWQQNIWSKFVVAHPNAPAGLDEIRKAFSWCYIHQNDLETVESARRGPKEIADAFSEMRQKEFPYCFGYRLCPACVAACDQWLAGHPFIAKPKPQIAWHELEACLLEIAATEIRSFAAGHGQETFYGFAFDCNSDFGNVLLCLNTEASLMSQAISYKQNHPELYGENSIEEIADSLRWNMGDWAYQGFESRDYASRWEKYSDAVSANCIDEEKDPKTFLGPVQRKFLETVCRVAIRLADSHAFATLRRTDDFKMFVADGEESESKAWDRLNRVRSQP